MKRCGSISFKQHQDTLTYLNHLEENGWILEDAKEWIEIEKKIIRNIINGK